MKKSKDCSPSNSDSIEDDDWDLSWDLSSSNICPSKHNRQLPLQHQLLLF